MDVDQTIEHIREGAAAFADSGATPEMVKEFLETAVAIAMGDTKKVNALVDRARTTKEKQAKGFVDSITNLHNCAANILRNTVRKNADPLIQAVDRFGLTSLADAPENIADLVAISPPNNPGCSTIFNDVCNSMRDLVQKGWTNPKTGQPDSVSNAALNAFLQSEEEVTLAMHLQAFWSQTPESLETGFREVLDLVGKGPRLT